MTSCAVKWTSMRTRFELVPKPRNSMIVESDPMTMSKPFTMVVMVVPVKMDPQMAKQRLIMPAQTTKEKTTFVTVPETVVTVNHKRKVVPMLMVPASGV